MESDNVTLAMPQCSNAVPSEIDNNAKVLEDGSRSCPLCNSAIRSFYINFNEKMIMCENSECEFPFGHEDLQFIKEDNDVDSEDEVASVRSKKSQALPTTSCSIGSASIWTDIEKINKVYESEESQFENKPLDFKEYVHKKQDDSTLREEEKAKEEQILMNVEHIKELNMQLYHTEENTEEYIRNEKWIKNLMNLQGMSGVKLVKQEEIELLRKEEPGLGANDVIIDIDKGSKTRISTIKIELAKKED